MRSRRPTTKDLLMIAPVHRVVFVFLDGVGVGSSDATVNPFLTAPMPTFRRLFGDQWPVILESRPLGLWATGDHVRLYIADACLGVPGLPQSGTGTTSLLTGVNAARLLGQHAGPFPPAELRPLLRAKNLFTRVQQLGGRATLANAFPPFYLERLERGRARRTTMTQAALGAGLRLRDVNDLQRGRALSAFITNERWNRVAPFIPVISPEEAGIRLARLARSYTLTAFEFFQTDHVGHRRDISFAVEVLARVDGLLAGLISELDPTRDLVVMASDHGNCEDLSTNQHTRNPVPVFVWGAVVRDAPSIRRITDVVPFILHHLTVQPGPSSTF